MCASWFNSMIRSLDAWVFHQFAFFLCLFVTCLLITVIWGPYQIQSYANISPPLFAQTTLNECFLSLQTACTGPTGSSAARRATAKVASVTGRREPASPSNSSPRSPATSRMSRKQVNTTVKIAQCWCHQSDVLPNQVIEINWVIPLCVSRGRGGLRRGQHRPEHGSTHRQIHGSEEAHPSLTGADQAEPLQCKCSINL